MNRSTTSRGFAVYDEFTDTYGSEVIVQESSLAEGARVWIFCRHGGFPEQANEPHLDVEQAKRVRGALDAFITEAGQSAEGSGLPRVNESDDQLVAMARELGPALRASSSDRDRLAGYLLGELADRLAAVGEARDG